ncbi:serine/threonine-protein kinase [Allorhizocola rhizosphaerae]|uniref:serine/threonine-protein kinase n=1 Tax=Allorhizocola rhizosphaerae TaxID=1872709 RepID=UPI000E3D015F|nr:serine/threonine-protein kinase [Allorhizocola rhizosphaerae]
MSELSIPGYDGFRLLGRGGFSAVYEARQVEYDRQVAVKVLDIGINDETVRRRVQRERAATGRLTGHPHIVTILDSGFLADGRPFLTMALCPGGSLADRVAREGPLPIADVLRIGVKIAGALETAHRNEITHRDVKPENILLTAYGEPALADFGISTVVDQRSLTRNTQAYTPNHAPPEVLRGEPASVRSDVYNLGSTLYQLLAGHPPFALSGSAGLAVFVDRVLNQEAPPPRDDLPESLPALLRRAMAKDPASRFATAAELGTALQQIQRELGQPVDELPLIAPTAASAAAGATAAPHADATILPPQPTRGVFVGGADGMTFLPPKPDGGSTPPPAGDATVLPPRPGMTSAASPPVGEATMMGDRVGAPTAPPASKVERPERGRWPVLAAAVVCAVLLVSGGTYAAVQYLGDDRGGSGAAVPDVSEEPKQSGGTDTAGPVPSPTTTPSPTRSPGPSVEPTGPAVASLNVSHVQCQNRSHNGWLGEVTVKWRLARADNVQLLGPDAHSSLGGFHGDSGEETFEMPCVPGQSFLVRAVPQKQSSAGTRKDYNGKWPDGARLVTFSVHKYVCTGSSGQLEVEWTTDNADEVRLFLNGTQQFTGIPNGPSETVHVQVNCSNGQEYFIRGVAYKGGKAGGSRQVNIRWP